MKVKLLVDVPAMDCKAGDVCELDDWTAEIWIERGNAEKVAPAPKKKVAAKKKTVRKGTTKVETAAKADDVEKR